jgi:hypothetical protein
MAGATGEAPTFGPCSAYADWDDVERCGSCPDVDAEERAFLLAVATEIVYGITDGKYLGQCVRSFTPCRPGCVAVARCSCGGPAKARLDLGPEPVWGAFVTVDGVEIEVSIEDWRYLIREDGEPWPSCVQASNWNVEVTVGWPIPSSITMATARLTCEMAKQCNGDDCALDPRTTSYTREGVTVQIADPALMIAARRTGIPAVDLILGNPMHRIGGQLVDLAAERGGGTSWP